MRAVLSGDVKFQKKIEKPLPMPAVRGLRIAMPVPIMNTPRIYASISNPDTAGSSTKLQSAPATAAQAAPFRKPTVAPTEFGRVENSAQTTPVIATNPAPDGHAVTIQSAEATSTATNARMPLCHASTGSWWNA